MRRRVWGLSGRLIASYIVVTLAAVVLVEVLALCFLLPPLVISAQLESQLQSQVDATATSYAQQLADGVPSGTVLGDRGQGLKPATIRPNPDGTLAIPAITGPVPGGLAEIGRAHV